MPCSSNLLAGPVLNPCHASLMTGSNVAASSQPASTWAQEHGDELPSLSATDRCGSGAPMLMSMRADRCRASPVPCYVFVCAVCVCVTHTQCRRHAHTHTKHKHPQHTQTHTQCHPHTLSHTHTHCAVCARARAVSVYVCVLCVPQWSTPRTMATVNMAVHDVSSHMERLSSNWCQPARTTTATGVVLAV